VARASEASSGVDAIGRGSSVVLLLEDRRRQARAKTLSKYLGLEHRWCAMMEGLEKSVLFVLAAEAVARPQACQIHATILNWVKVYFRVHTLHIRCITISVPENVHWFKAFDLLSL